MTGEPMAVVKYEYAMPGVPVSPEQDALNRAIREIGNRAVAGIGRWMNATPEQRAEWVRERELREAEAACVRAGERAATATVPATVAALIAKMGWCREYAEHLVQPYCECGDDIDGWSYCEHAQDLGLAP